MHPRIYHYCFTVVVELNFLKNLFMIISLILVELNILTQIWIRNQ
jgi:hypothetical protein